MDSFGAGEQATKVARVTVGLNIYADDIGHEAAPLKETETFHVFVSCELWDDGTPEPEVKTNDRLAHTLCQLYSPGVFVDWNQPVKSILRGQPHEMVNCCGEWRLMEWEWLGFVGADM